MIELERVSPGVQVLRLAYGPVSAMDTDLLEAIRATVAETAAAGDALVITGTGKAFCAGVNLRRFLDGGADYVATFWPALSGVFDDLLRYPRPVVAAINGHAIAGGCVLACAADYRLMSAGTIGMPELIVGIPFPSSALAAVALAVGPRGPGLINSGDTIKPDAALARGLVDEVVAPEDLMERAILRVTRLAAVPPQTFSQNKTALRRAVLAGLDTPESIAEDAEAQKIWASAEGQAAVARYVEATIPRKS